MRPFALALAVAAAFSGASAAQADTFSPPGVTVGFVGTVTIRRDTPIVCDLYFTLRTTPYDSNGDNVAYVEDLTVTGSPLCALYDFPDISHSVYVSYPVAPPSGVPAQRLRAYGVQMSFPFMGGFCGPEDIELYWNDGPPATITIPVGTEINPPTPGCKISGVFTSALGHTLTITN